MGSLEVGLGRKLVHARELGGRVTQGRLYAPYVQYIREINENRGFFFTHKAEYVCTFSDNERFASFGVFSSEKLD